MTRKCFSVQCSGLDAFSFMVARASPLIHYSTLSPGFAFSQVAIDTVRFFAIHMGLQMIFHLILLHLMLLPLM